MAQVAHPPSLLTEVTPMVFSGPSLRAARRRTRTPARALARAAGRTERSVFAYETGTAQPPIAVASRLAAELGIDLVDLLTDDPQGLVS